MGYLGPVPSERSTGESVRRGGIMRAGNGRVRHMLVESAWTYRHPPKLGKTKRYRLEQASPAVREIAWKAQSQLTARHRRLAARGKRATVVCAAIARELVGFMWTTTWTNYVKPRARYCKLFAEGRSWRERNSPLPSTQRL